MEQLEQIIGYTFQNKKLLKQALTHSSYANEKKLGKLGCNERLEFLGDAVLELISSDFLYAKFTQVPEGELTKKRASLVCEPSLAYCARQFGLPQYLLLGKGENMTGGRNRDSIVSDATEALLGAIYLDGGFEPAKDFVLKFILNDIEHKQLFYDSKTILQELIYKLLDKVDPETGCVRSVTDHGFSYQVFEAIDNKMSWYVALDEDGILLSFGMDYDEVVVQAESCVDLQLKVMEDDEEAPK